MNGIKKKVIIICSICLLVLVIGLFVDNILGKDHFIELNYNDVIDKLENKEDFVLLVSQTTCSHCAAYKPKLKDVANEYKLEIYYIEYDLLSDDEKNKFKTYVNISQTPATVFIHDGFEETAASRISGDASKEKIVKKLKSNGFLD